MKILHVVGARPNFMKVAPVRAALAEHDGVRQVLVHTGQHYDSFMSDIFFRQLDIPEPDFNLEVGSGSHAKQTAEIMTRIEPVILESGAEAGLKKYDELRKENNGQLFFTEGLMNALGYRLLSKDKTTDAIEVFKFNAKEYPESFNVYDSLGEAYYKNGDMELAVKNFERSVEMNPNNENGKAMLEKIKSER